MQFSSSAGAPKPGGSAQPIGGGFGEAFDEQAQMQAMSQAMAQKSSSQQAASSQTQALQQGQGGTAAASDFGTNEAAMQQMQKQAGAGAKQQQPREVSTLTDELIKRPISDVAEGIKSIFNLYDLFNVNPVTQTPEQQAKKRQIHQRFQQLTQEEQAEAQRQYQEEMERKQQEEQEAHEKRQREQQAASQSIEAPSGSKKGPVGPSGSSKQRAVTKLQTDRKQLGGPSSSN